MEISAAELAQLEKRILNLNRQAMNQLSEEKFGQSIKVLKEAESLLSSLADSQPFSKLLAITLNNYGCIYKRMKRPITALKYLKQASQYEKLEPIDRINLAGTYLNICAIYSDLGKHDLALAEAKKALELLKNNIENSENQITTLVIAYHNAGVQYEFMNKIQNAVDCYKAAWETSLDCLGMKHPLTTSMSKSFTDATEKSLNETARQTARQDFRTSNKIPPPQKISRNEGRNLNTTLPESRLPKIKYHTIRRKSQPSQDYGISHKKNMSVDVSRVKAALDPNHPIDIINVRFLTGDRLQPMFNHDYKHSLFLNTTISHDPPASRLNKSNIENKRISTAPLQKRPMKEALRNIGDHITKLQNRLDDFNNLVKPLRDINEENRTDSTFSRYSIDTLLYQRNQAAIKIQAAFRGFRIRNNEALRIKSKKTVRIVHPPSRAMNMPDKGSPISVSEIAGFDLIRKNHDKSISGLYEGNKNSDYANKNTEKKKINGEENNPQVNAAILIQKHIRKFICRSIYKNILGAIVFLQAWIRGYLTRKRIKINKDSL
ncbi:unnamed protein product [Blepharisma stoltei]|uniref:Uncharacterized protein n=1 Tax=Blepharisma stoltei TaxID=1481888 RepID=A0AAU9J710_9CILI|nr:unnamed protein product [Blepharisma stoltei]